MSAPSRDELAALEAAAMNAAGLTLDDAPRTCAACNPDGSVEFSFFGPPPDSAHVARVVVDSDGNATVED
jgi:hypothetical protein